MQVYVNVEKIGILLKSYRKKKGLSQLEVAKKLGYSSSQFVSNWERGLSSPPLKTLKELAVIYGIPPKKIMDIITKDVQMTIKEAFVGNG